MEIKVGDRFRSLVSQGDVLPGDVFIVKTPIDQHEALATTATSTLTWFIGYLDNPDTWERLPALGSREAMDSGTRTPFVGQATSSKTASEEMSNPVYHSDAERWSLHIAEEARIAAIMQSQDASRTLTPARVETYEPSSTARGGMTGGIWKR